MISVKRMPGRLINDRTYDRGGLMITKNSQGFSDAVQHTMAWNEGSARGVLSKPLLSKSKSQAPHLWSPSPGKVASYSVNHTEVNPYKAGAALAGTAAVGYGTYKGVQWARHNPNKAKAVGRNINKSVGGFYSKHPIGLDRAHNTAQVGAFFGTATLGGFAAGTAANVGMQSYGHHQAQNLTGKKWQTLRREAKIRYARQYR